MPKKKKRKPQQKKTSQRNLKLSYKSTRLLALIIIPIVTGALGGIIATVLSVYPLKALDKSPDSPSLHIQPNSFTSSVNFVLKYIDKEDEYYDVVENGKYGILSFDLTNNDERDLVINEMNFVLLGYEPIEKAKLYPIPWSGGYSEYINYGVQVRDSTGDYPCVLLSNEELMNLTVNNEFPSTNALNTFTEHIEGKGCDSVRIFISPTVSGIYRYKIRIDYSIGESEKSVETEEMFFASLSPDEWRELEVVCL